MANKVTFTTQGDTTIAEFDYDNLDDIESKATKAKVSSEGGVTNREFPDTWPVSSSYTTKQFCDVVNADETAIQGMSYLGEVMFSDLPASIANAEIVVEIMDGTGTSGKVIHLILTSGNVNPYRWEYTYWNDGANVSGWVAFETTANKVTSVSAQSTDTEYPTAKCVYDFVEPNPTLAGTEALLAGLGINGTKYKIPDAVEGNPTVPSGTTPTALENLRIGNNYFSAGGGGGSNHLYSHSICFENGPQVCFTIINQSATAMDFNSVLNALSPYNRNKPLLANYVTSRWDSVSSRLLVTVISGVYNGGDYIGSVGMYQNSNSGDAVRITTSSWSLWDTVVQIM